MLNKPCVAGAYEVSLKEQASYSIQRYKCQQIPVWCARIVNLTMQVSSFVAFPVAPKEKSV